MLNRPTFGGHITSRGMTVQMPDLVGHDGNDDYC